MCLCSIKHCFHLIKFCISTLFPNNYCLIPCILHLHIHKFQNYFENKKNDSETLCRLLFIKNTHFSKIMLYLLFVLFCIFSDGRRFVISKLKSNTTYLMRAASRNLAGLSDWSVVKIFATLKNFASHTVTFVIHHVIIILAFGFITNSVLRNF